MRDTRDVKASGLQGEALPEIIEILDDGTDPFGDRATNTTNLDTGGPRWVGPASIINAMRSPRLFSTCSARVGLTWPKRFADGAAIPPPKALRSCCAIG